LAYAVEMAALRYGVRPPLAATYAAATYRMSAGVCLIRARLESKLI